MAALKMWIGNYDGRRQGLVVASNRQRAIDIIDTDPHDFDNFWAEVPSTRMDAEDPAGDIEPDVLYLRPFQRFKNSKWKKREVDPLDIR